MRVHGREGVISRVPTVASSLLIPPRIMEDFEFDQLLRTTRDDVPLSSAFNQEVWHRIENAEMRRSPEILRFSPVMKVIGRPWGAVAGVAAMATFGLWLGAVTAPEGQDGKLVYAQSISPFNHSRGK